jgi:hypothetical protein
MFTKTKTSIALAIIFAIAVASAALPLTSSPASAAVCFAESPTGSYGWAQGGPDYARQRALVECSIRTPSDSYCVITSCSY